MVYHARGIDNTKPLTEQFVEVLKKRFIVDAVGVGGEAQYYRKAALCLKALAEDYYAKHPEEAKEYVEE